MNHVQIGFKKELILTYLCLPQQIIANFRKWKTWVRFLFMLAKKKRLFLSSLSYSVLPLSSNTGTKQAPVSHFNSCQPLSLNLSRSCSSTCRTSPYLNFLHYLGYRVWCRRDAAHRQWQEAYDIAIWERKLPSLPPSHQKDLSEYLVLRINNPIPYSTRVSGLILLPSALPGTRWDHYTAGIVTTEEGNKYSITSASIIALASLQCFWSSASLLICIL